MTNKLAYIDEQGNVTRVILADPSFDPSAMPCSNEVSAGFTYINGFFYPPQPYPSWTMSETAGEWIPPTPEPEEGFWRWDEDSLTWVDRTPQQG